jgi:hypothetical protein
MMDTYKDQFFYYINLSNTLSKSSHPLSLPLPFSHIFLIFFPFKVKIKINTEIFYLNY